MRDDDTKRFLNRKGDVGDMFTIMVLLGFGIMVIIVFILFINKINTAIGGDPNIPSAGKTFISNIQLTIPEKERHKKLQDICKEFTTIAFSYGFTIDEIIVELQNTNPK